MIFGNVDNPSLVNFVLLPDHKDTKKVLKQAGRNGKPEVYVGCAKWNRTELKGFYPRGTKDELAYYASQFNSIELNASFYGTPSILQVTSWHNKTPGSLNLSLWIMEAKKIWRSNAKPYSVPTPLRNTYTTIAGVCIGAAPTLLIPASG